MSREIKPLSNALNSENSESNDYKDRLVKLIPSEIIAAYVTFSGIIDGFAKSSPQSKSTTLLWIIIVLLLILTPIYLRVISGVNSIKQLVFSSFAFFIWAHATNSPYDNKIILGFPFEIIIAMILIFYTLLIPFIYKGK